MLIYFSLGGYESIKRSSVTPSDRLKVSVQASEPEAPLGPGPPGVLLLTLQAPVVRAACQ